MHIFYSLDFLCFSPCQKQPFQKMMKYSPRASAIHTCSCSGCQVLAEVNYLQNWVLTITPIKGTCLFPAGTAPVSVWQRIWGWVVKMKSDCTIEWDQIKTPVYPNLPGLSLTQPPQEKWASLASQPCHSWDVHAAASEALEGLMATLHDVFDNSLRQFPFFIWAFL